jgi:WD40 repeat protein
MRRSSPWAHPERDEKPYLEQMGSIPSHISRSSRTSRASTLADNYDPIHGEDEATRTRMPFGGTHAPYAQEPGQYKHVEPSDLTVLSEPDNPVADLVFVHGLGGSDLRSWSADGSEQAFWPENWLPQETLLDHTRISTYHYNSLHDTYGATGNLLDISGFAKDLLAKLCDTNSEDFGAPSRGSIPLIFVAHSLGGLIVKKAYVLAKSDNHAVHWGIANATVAFVFFSTPHRPSLDSTVIADILSAFLTEGHHASDEGSIQRVMPRLREINRSFEDLTPQMHMLSFFEQTPLPGAITDGSLMLSPNLTTFSRVNEKSIPLQANHLTIAQFPSRMDHQYLKVRDALRSLVSRFKPIRQREGHDDDARQMDQVRQLLPTAEDPELDREIFSERRARGSCEWIFRDPIMMAFLDNQQSQPLALWCTGRPGSGKSVAATCVIDSLLERDAPCAYYFFKSGEHVRNNLKQFILSVSLQLAAAIPEYRRQIATEKFNGGRAAHSMLWKRLFSGMLFKCNIRTPVYLIVDGIDEFDMSEALMTKLSEFGETSIPLRLLLVSRRTPNIQIFTRDLSQSIRLQEMAWDRSSEDITRYVREKLDNYAHKRVYIREVLSKADGNFLWARLVVDEIRRCNTEDQVRNALDRVPRELEPLYQWMDKRLAEKLPTDDLRMGRMIMSLTACAKRPLHLAELKAALEYSFSTILAIEDTVKALCGDFISVDKKGTVSMTHASARQFLTSHTDLYYYVDLARAGQNIFAECMRALTNDNGGMDQTFLPYAASSWPFHLTQSTGCFDQDSLSRLMELFDSAFLLEWIHILVQRGELRSLVDASKALSQFLKWADAADAERSPLLHQLTHKERLQDWAQDLVRIVGKFGPKILQHPRSVYMLMPAFCPTGSILYKSCFEDAARSLRSHELSLTIRGTLNPEWDDCFAKFTVTTRDIQSEDGCLPEAIINLDHYFAILTKSSVPNGVVNLYYSATCELARSYEHPEIVTVIAFNSNATRMATYGLINTRVWDVSTGELKFSIANPKHVQAKAMVFFRTRNNEEVPLTFSDDCVLRLCSNSEQPHVSWQEVGTIPRTGPRAPPTNYAYEANAPHNAKFSPDGRQIAVSYRATVPSVWRLDNYAKPYNVEYCDERARGIAIPCHVVLFAWNSITGHLLGIYDGGTIFKWHPQKKDFKQRDLKCQVIKCSADGRLFVTGDEQGVLKIWDFDNFEPIYKLYYPFEVKDLDLGRSQPRVYDIRDKYCHIWEPNSLVRAMEGEEGASDSRSVPSLASEADKENFEPITAFSACRGRDVYAIGKEDDYTGQVSVCDYDGQVLSRMRSRLTPEKLAWCPSKAYLASNDLEQETNVWKFELNKPSDKLSLRTPSLLRTFKENSNVKQIMFDSSGSYLLVTLSLQDEHSLEIRSLTKSSIVTIPSPEPSYWTILSNQNALAVGFNSRQVTLFTWADPLQFVGLLYKDLEGDTGQIQGSVAVHNPRRPSDMRSLSPSEIDNTVHKVLSSPNDSLVLVEIFGNTRQARRRSNCLLIETKSLIYNRTQGTVPVCSIPSALLDILCVSLGFVHAECLLPPRRGTGTTPWTRGPQCTFAFIDKDFWVCTVDMIFGIAQVPRVRKHFFLPMDWQNVEWLDMATVTPEGQVLCPRNGDIAVISNGFLEDFSLDV